jgi:pimeloyl-ACP methyl ester carboxylesterase
MGLAAQMINWPEGFCAELVAHGVQVIWFDNRDVGLSSHFSESPAPDLAAALSGDTSSASYTLSDMAADAVGLLDALGLDSAYIAGTSTGGMIAQTIAIEHPGRVRSLTSMMSTG